MERFSQFFTHIARRMLVVAALGYGAALVALSVLWAIAAERNWLIALTNIFAPLFFMPLLLLIPAALLVRSRWLRGATLVALVICVAALGGRLTSTFAARAEGAPLRVATFNLWQSNERVADTIAAIRRQQADVVALQELSGPMALVIERDLADVYPYQYLTPGMSTAGLGVISRYPLIETVRGFRVPGQRVRIDINGELVTLVNVHLTAPRYLPRYAGNPWHIPPLSAYNSATRDNQMDRLLAALDELDGPIVVVGDFNMGDREPRYAQLAATLRDAYRETAWGFGFTFPNNKTMFGIPIPFPLVRIDYVWTRGDLAPLTAWVDCNHGSDHCMVVADLVVTERG
jgi:vancomycin resistance protein VanJ